jgi:hypothetical protein
MVPGLAKSISMITNLRIIFSHLNFVKNQRIPVIFIENRKF